MRTTSNRELARQIGVSETAVRRAEKAVSAEPNQRFRGELAGTIDVAAWGGLGGD